MNFKRKLFIAVFTLLITATSANTSFAFNLEAAQAYNQALDLYINGKTTDAITQFERATNLDPNFSDAYYNLGSIYRYTGQLTKAEEAFQKVLNLKPNDTSINYDLALVSIQKNDLKRAYSYLKLVNKDSDRFNDAQNKIAFIKKEVGESELKNASVAQVQTNSRNTNKESSGVVATSNSQPVQNVSKVESTQTPTSNTAFKTDTSNSVVASNNASQVVLNQYTSNQTVSEDEEIDVKPAKLTLSKKELKEELKAEEKEFKAEQKELKAERALEKKQNKIKLEDTNLMAKDQSDTSKFWDKYNFNNDKKSNERVETVKKATEDNENLAVNYYTVEDTSNKSKLKLSSSKKNDKNKALPFKNSDNDTKSFSSNSTPATRLAIKTFATGFNGPTGIVRDSQGNFFIANYTENKIYKVNSKGDKSVFAASDEINGPLGLAMDDSGNIYVANYLSNSIAKVTSDGNVTTVATGLKKPYFLYFDNSGMLYVSEQDSNTISEIKLSSKS